MKSKVNQVLVCLSLLLVMNTAHGQINHSNIIIGYDTGSLSATNYVFDHRINDETGEFESIPLQDLKMRTSAFKFELRAISGEWGMISSGIKARLDHKDENDARISGRFGDLFWMDAAFGGRLTNFMNLFAGGQWKQAGFRGRMDDYGDWNTIGSAANGPGFEDIYVRNHFGRTERGINANMLLSFFDDHIILRAKYEYNWLKMRGIPGNTGWKFFRYTGRNHVFNAELLTYFSTDEDRDYGISIGAQYLTGFLDFGYQEGHDKGVFVPRTDFNQLQFSVSIFLAARGIDSSL